MKEKHMSDSRVNLLPASHMCPLMQLIKQWRSEGLEVPNPDPNDGGVNAKALFLLESPGPKAVGSQFISRDNPDPSARNLGVSLALSGIARSDSLIWNVVPYCVSTINSNKNASPAQIRSAIPYTQDFIDLLTNLRAIVFCGRRAQIARPLLKLDCKVFETYHPGAMAYNRRYCRDHLHATFAQVGRIISE